MKLRPLLIIAVTIGFFVLLFFGLQPETETNLTADTAEETPLLLQQLELYEYQDNKESLRVFAQQAQVFEEKELTLLFGVLAKLTEEDKDNPIKIRSNEAKITGETKFMTLQGKVQVEFGKGSSLNTEILYYDQEAKRLYNQHLTTIENEHDTIVADSLVYATEKEILTLIKPVVTVFEL